MKKTAINKKKPGEKLANISPEFDSARQQTALLETMHIDIKLISESYNVLDRKLDNIKSELDTVKLAVKDVDQRTIKLESGLNAVKLTVNNIDQRTIKLESGQQKIEQKLDAAINNYDHRITKLEEQVLT